MSKILINEQHVRGLIRVKLLKEMTVGLSSSMLLLEASWLKSWFGFSEEGLSWFESVRSTAAWVVGGIGLTVGLVASAAAVIPVSATILGGAAVVGTLASVTGTALAMMRVAKNEDGEMDWDPDWWGAVEGWIGSKFFDPKVISLKAAGTMVSEGKFVKGMWELSKNGVKAVGKIAKTAKKIKKNIEDLEDPLGLGDYKEWFEGLEEHTGMEKGKLSKYFVDTWDVMDLVHQGIAEKLPEIDRQLLKVKGVVEKVKQMADDVSKIDPAKLATKVSQKAFYKALKLLADDDKLNPIGVVNKTKGVKCAAIKSKTGAKVKAKATTKNIVLNPTGTKPGRAPEPTYSPIASGVNSKKIDCVQKIANILKRLKDIEQPLQQLKTSNEAKGVTDEGLDDALKVIKMIEARDMSSGMQIAIKNPQVETAWAIVEKSVVEPVVNKPNAGADVDNNGAKIYEIPNLPNGYKDLAKILNQEFPAFNNKLTFAMLRQIYHDKFLRIGDRLDLTDIATCLQDKSKKPKIYTGKDKKNLVDVFDKRPTVAQALAKLKQQ